MHPLYNFFLRFSNLTLLLMLGMALLVVILGTILPTDGNYSVIAGAALTYAGVALLVKNGKFIYSKYLKFFSILLGIQVLTILFIILQLPGSTVAIFIFPVGVVALYTAWFFSKPQKYFKISMGAVIYGYPIV